MKNLSVLPALLLVLSCASCDREKEPSQSKPESTQAIRGDAVINYAPKIEFEDFSEIAGLDFYYEDGAEGDKWAPETMIGGVSFFDYDNDGDADLMAVSGKKWDEYENGSGKNTLSLYRNDDGKSFTDVTNEVGLIFNGYGFSAVVGDYDNDGWQDIYVTALGENKLFKNYEGKKFLDVTEKNNVQGSKGDYSIGAAFFDADNDGDLDLFVANYMQWSKQLDMRINENINNLDKAYSGPSYFESSKSYFYRNYGDIGFKEESRSAGLDVESRGKAIGKTLGILPVDINNDGYIDLITANDQIRNFAFINNGSGNFTEQGEEIGIAYNNLGKSTAAMGVDAAWLSKDLLLTVAMGNYASEMTSVYVFDREHEVFSDDAPITGIGPDSRKSLTFGVLFLDLDLDGRMDFVQANGHVEPDISLTQKSQAYKQPAQLFWNCGSDCSRPFVLLPATSVGELYEPLAGRGLAAADYDNDGDIDIAISEIGGRLRLFKNNQKTSNNWLRLELSQPDKNRFAVGAIVEIHHGGHVQKQHLMPTRSYVSQVENILTFGLGDSKSVDSINITWPDGQHQVLSNINANQKLKIVKDINKQ